MHRIAVIVGCAVACGGTPHATPIQTPATPSTSGPAPAPTPDPDLEQPPKPKLLAIDWNTIELTTDADALALWTKLELTVDDWHDKLDEVPTEFDRALAIAFLKEGRFDCVPARPAGECVPQVFDIPEPRATAGLGDPCFRRLIALWAIEQLEPEDAPVVMDGLRKIAALPPPESQLTVAALKAVPDSEPARRLELVAIAFNAGQRDIANNALGQLDEAFLVEAVTKHHIDGALEMLPVSTQRATYLAALADDRLPTKARTTAITELVTSDAAARFAPDLKAALVKATAAADCGVAAAAARALSLKGEAKYLPKRPRTAAVAPMMRALCVLVSYERLQGNDEASLLPSFLPAKGLERIKVTYDALSDTDPDGDGNPHTEHTTDLVPKAEAVLPEIEDLERAMRSCKGTTCKSEQHEFTFVMKQVGGQQLLARLEIVERPPCPKT